ADGKVVIGGQFTEVDGLDNVNIARLNPDGLVDASFDPGTGAKGPSASVEAVALQADGKILIGGNFATVNDIDRKGIARLNADGSLDQSFDAGTGVEDIGSDGSDIVGLVSSVVVQSDGKILLGGTFFTVDQINRHGLARLNRDGSLDGTFGPYFGTTYRNDFGYEEIESVRALALQADGKVLIGGTFVSADGSPTNRLTRLLSTNVRTASFEFSSPSVSVSEGSGSVPTRVIRRGDSDGAFTVEYATTDGTATTGLDYTPQSGVLQFAALEVEKTITSLIRDDGVLEEDETFSVSLLNPSAGAALGAPTNFVARIFDGKKPGNLDSTFAAVDIPFPADPTRSLPVTAIVIQPDQKALVAGNFATVNGTNRAGVVRLSADGSIDPSFVPQAPAGSEIL
ncbi:MAG: Calx-beta domain-containing protein, partial [Phycisphaerales bacterium]|nr:Calx-beta domain-containing protein [Phycisphaerales bacterium]